MSALYQVPFAQRAVGAMPMPAPYNVPPSPAGARSADDGVAAEIAHLFQGIRRVLHVSHAQAAKILLTDVRVIEALDIGDIAALPAWPETQRIVSGYISLAGIDPEPALQMIARSMAAQYQARARQAARPVAPPPTAAPSARQSRLARLAAFAPRQRKSVFAVTLPVALGIIVATTDVLEAAVGQMPEGVTRVVRTVQDYMREAMAPVRDGLRWIEVSDPRSRRGDKLR